MRLQILIPLLFAVAGHAAVVFPEVPVSAPVYGPASGNQNEPGIASDGTDFLVVWSDDRSGLHATRLSRTGEILDGTGIPLGSGGGGSVVWSGTSYVIVWSQMVWSAVPAMDAVMIARIDRHGSVIERPRVLIAGAYAPSVATNGSRIAVAYQRKHEGSLSHSLHLAVLDAEGALIDGDIPIPTRARSNYELTVTSNGSNFLAVWTAVTGPDATLDSVRIGADGTLLDDVPRTLSPGYAPSRGPLVASDGRDYLLFRRDVRRNQLLAIPIGADGQPNGSARPVPAETQEPAVTWTGSSYLLVWAESSSVFGVHLDARGLALGEPRIVGEPDTPVTGTQIAVGAAGGDALIAWTDGRHSRLWTDVVATIVRGAGLHPAPLTLLSVSAPAQWAPSVASGGAHSLVTWSEESGLYAARLDAGGHPAGGRGTVLSTQDAFFGSSSLVFDGRNYLAAWTEVEDDEWMIRTAIVSPETGEPLAGRGATIRTCGRHLAIATGADRLLVWSTCDGSIAAARIDHDGRLIDPVPLLLPRRADPRLEPAAAWSGSAWLITWMEPFDQPPNGPSPMYRQARIVGARVSPALTLLDPEPLRIAEGDPAKYVDPAVASDGTGFAIVWRKVVGLERDAPIGLAYLGADGALGPPLLLGTGDDPSIAWDGSRFLVAWERGGSGDVVGAYVSPNAADGSRVIEIAASEDAEQSPSLAAAGPQRVLAVYTRVSTEPLYGTVPRVFARIISGVSRTRAVRR
ncbi:MAG TPA: hypothetical protein VMS56_02680 [Thermoanaerobaculia bacterium]|nr:hypothetical protein [Thermoanaerobaculia bacterium]